MLSTFHLRRVPGGLPPTWDRLSVRSRRTLPAALGAAVVSVCLLFPGHDGVSAPADSPADAQPPAARPATARPTDDGFTRESMEELARPVPGPVSTAPRAHTRTARVRVKRSRPDPKDFASRSVRFRHREPEQSKPQIVIRGRRHRNFVESFIYGWNGWVIRTFHTKVGTVLLGTMGAKT